jgi:hypothetical protein
LRSKLVSCRDDVIAAVLSGLLVGRITECPEAERAKAIGLDTAMRDIAD